MRFTPIRLPQIYLLTTIGIFDERAALDLFRQFADQHVSFTDCVSFVLMRKNHLSQVFAFDRHFAYAGFAVQPL